MTLVAVAHFAIDSNEGHKKLSFAILYEIHIIANDIEAMYPRLLLFGHLTNDHGQRSILIATHAPT